jgi:hypothetical protein
LPFVAASATHKADALALQPQPVGALTCSTALPPVDPNDVLAGETA